MVEIGVSLDNEQLIPGETLYGTVTIDALQHEEDLEVNGWCLEVVGRLVVNVNKVNTQSDAMRRFNQAKAGSHSFTMFSSGRHFFSIDRPFAWPEQRAYRFAVTLPRRLPPSSSGVFVKYVYFVCVTPLHDNLPIPSAPQLSSTRKDNPATEPCSLRMPFTILLTGSVSNLATPTNLTVPLIVTPLFTATSSTTSQAAPIHQPSSSSSSSLLSSALASSVSSSSSPRSSISSGQDPTDRAGRSSNNHDPVTISRDRSISSANHRPSAPLVSTLPGSSGFASSPASHPGSDLTAPPSSINGFLSPARSQSPSTPTTPSLLSSPSHALSHTPQHSSSSSSSQGPLFFNIAKCDDDSGAQDDRVLRCTLLRRFHRPGDTIRVHLNFATGWLPCYRIAVTLDTLETLQPAFRLSRAQSFSDPPTPSSPFTARRTHGDFHMYALQSESCHILFSLPSSAVPNFSTDIVDVRWVLRFKFIIRSHMPPLPPPPLPTLSSVPSSMKPPLELAQAKSSPFSLTSLLTLPLKLFSSSSSSPAASSPPPESQPLLPRFPSSLNADSLSVLNRPFLPLDFRLDPREVECLDWELPLKIVPHVFSLPKAMSASSTGPASFSTI